MEDFLLDPDISSALVIENLIRILRITLLSLRMFMLKVAYSPYGHDLCVGIFSIKFTGLYFLINPLWCTFFLLFHKIFFEELVCVCGM